MPARRVRRRIHMGLGRGPILRNDGGMATIGFLFPGQGSQFAGMGKDFVDAFPWARELYDIAQSILGFDLADVCFNGPEETLKQTRYTQPAIVVHSVIANRLLREKGIVPVAVAGHSLGEFSALIASGLLAFEAGLELVRERSRLMQEAGTKRPGAMAAVIGLSAQEVISVCSESSSAGLVQAANFNSPDQTVISGSKEGVAKAAEIAKAKGAKRVLELPVSGAFHSPLMAEVAEEFASVLKKTDFQNPFVPVYANVTASPVTDLETIRDLLSKQMTHSVRWVETIQNMIKNGITKFYEVGPGKVLAGLVKRIDKGVEVIPCGSVAEIAAAA
jgi:[acyl-carrier-protein] S-malonyltransferase